MASFDPSPRGAANSAPSEDRRQRLSVLATDRSVQVAVAKLLSLGPANRPKKRAALQSALVRSLGARTSARVYVLDPVQVVEELARRGELSLEQEQHTELIHILQEFSPPPDVLWDLAACEEDRARISRALASKPGVQESTQALVQWLLAQSFAKVQVGGCRVLQSLLDKGFVKETNDSKLEYHLPENQQASDAEMTNVSNESLQEQWPIFEGRAKAYERVCAEIAHQKRLKKQAEIQEEKSREKQAKREEEARQRLMQSYVSKAVQAGKVRRIRKLLEHRADVSKSLYLATSAPVSNVEMVDLLLEARANADNRSLQEAADAGHMDLFKHLLDSRASVASAQAQGLAQTLANNNKVEFLKFLLEKLEKQKGESIEGPPEPEETKGKGKGKGKSWKSIPVPYGKGLSGEGKGFGGSESEDEAADDSGPGLRAAVEIAAQRGNMEALQLLLDARASVSSSALQRAASHAQVEALEALLRVSNPNASKKRSEGKTLLHCAAESTPEALGDESRAISIVNVILSLRADVNEQSELGWTALHFAASSNATPIIGTLLEARAELNPQETDGRTPLHVAAACGKTNSLAALVGARADVNLAPKGMTALHCAALYCQRDTCIALLQLGADGSQVVGDVGGGSFESLQGKTAFQIVEECHNADYSAPMLQVEANPHVIDFSVGFYSTKCRAQHLLREWQAGLPSLTLLVKGELVGEQLRLDCFDQSGEKLTSVLWSSTGAVTNGLMIRLAQSLSAAGFRWEKSTSSKDQAVLLRNEPEDSPHSKVQRFHLKLIGPDNKSIPVARGPYDNDYMDSWTIPDEHMMFEVEGLGVQDQEEDEGSSEEEEEGVDVGQGGKGKGKGGSEDEEAEEGSDEGKGMFKGFKGKGKGKGQKVSLGFEFSDSDSEDGGKGKGKGFMGKGFMGKGYFGKGQSSDGSVSLATLLGLQP